MKKIGGLIGLLLIGANGFSQIAQHVHVDNDPVTTASSSIVVVIGIPLLLIALGFVWLAKRPIKFEITACGNNKVFRKELKHLANDRNIIKNRDLATDKEVPKN